MFQFPGFASHTYVFSMWYLKRGGFPHSEIPGSKLVYQLPEAYRRLLRPSSPVAAKASTMCAYSLDHITPSTLSCLIFSALASLFCSFVRSHTCVCSLSRSQNASLDRKISAQYQLIKTSTAINKTRLKSPGPFVSRLRDQERLYVLWVTLEWIMQITIYNIPIKTLI